MRPAVDLPMASAITARIPATASDPILIAFAKHAAATRIRDSFDRPETSTVTSSHLTLPFQVRCAIRNDATAAITTTASISNSDAILGPSLDRKSTRLNSSHLGISYAVFCLKKYRRLKQF